MSRVSSGINDFDRLIDSLYTGDNVVWEVEAGTSYEIFVHNFVRQSLADDQNVIYVSFNKSPQSILLQLRDIVYQENFVLLDCFTSGKGKNDKAFMKFYEQNADRRGTKVEKPFDISHFTDYLNSIEDRFPASKYVFDSLTGMQDLWGDESSTYKFFTYMCPRLYDLGTVAYWFIKKEVSLEVGTKVKELRMKLGMSQKELAEKVDLTPSFISQLENNQISPSIQSFLTICNALGVSPAVLWEKSGEKDKSWVIRKEKVSSNLLMREKGFGLFGITRNGKVSSNIAVIEPNTRLKKHFLAEKGKELIYVLKGNVSAVIDGKEEILHEGDSLYLEEYLVSSWKNEGADAVELLVICL